MRNYRNWVYLWFFTIFVPFILFPLHKQGLVSIESTSVVVPIFIGGLLALGITMFYFSGSKNILTTEIIKYPFQFIEDPQLRKEEVEKKIKSNIQAVFIIVITLGILYWFEILNLKTVVLAVLTVIGTTPYRIAQFRSLI